MAEIPAAGSISFEDRAVKQIPFEWGYGCTPRVAKLRDELYFKASVIEEWGAMFMGLFDSKALNDKISFRKNVRLDVDRARLVTQAYKETEGQPTVISMARALEKICEELPIFIKKGELIVGDANSAPDEVRWFPEISVSYLPASITDGAFARMVTDEERAEILDICKYWESKCLEAQIETAMPPQGKSGWASIFGIPSSMGASGGFYSESACGPAYDYDKLFSDGVQARIDRAEAKLKELESNAAEMNPADYLEKKYNWEAMAICGKAMIRFAQRYAELARQQAREENDETRRNELEETAATLDWVPANPPRTFQEALQFYWMIEVVARYLAVHGYGCGIRIDQIWWPYYAADMKADRITRAKALELVECLFVKIQEVGIPACWPPFFAALAGGEIFYTADLGGSIDGKDACNDLTCICLEAQVDLRLNQPPIAMLYHGNINQDVVDRAIDLERAGSGHPAFFNEDLLEKWGLLRGYSREVAKNTAAAGCVANFVKGKFTMHTGIVECGGFVGPKLLERVFFQGGDLVFGTEG